MSATETITSNRNAETIQMNNTNAKALRVRSSVKVGGPGLQLQHGEAKGLRVRSSVKAGGIQFNHSEAKGLRMRTPVTGLSRTVRVGVASAASVLAFAVASPAAHASTRAESSRSVLTVSFDLSAAADVAPCGYCGGGIKLNHSEAGAQRLRTR